MVTQGNFGVSWLTSCAHSGLSDLLWSAGYCLGLHVDPWGLQQFSLLPVLCSFSDRLPVAFVTQAFGDS